MFGFDRVTPPPQNQADRGNGAKHDRAERQDAGQSQGRENQISPVRAFRRLRHNGHEERL